VTESQTVTVCRLVADDWQTYRAIRLAMLQESPSAFGGTHDEAAGNNERVWRQRLTGNVVLLARMGRTPAGSAMYSVFGATDPGDCSLFGMWVDPGFRRAGVGRILVDSVGPASGGSWSTPSWRRPGPRASDASSFTSWPTTPEPEVSTSEQVSSPQVVAFPTRTTTG